jgi:hypothetical protein
MKNTTVLTLLLITFSVAACSCCKKNDEPTADNTYGLPNATQEGKNTFGFLLNGKPWTPKGQVGVSANLTVNVDFGYNKGIFVIGAYRFNSSGNKETFTIAVRDSLNFLPPPFTISLNRTSLYSITFRNENNCDYFNQLADVQSFGSLNVLKLDKNSRILSGIFNATLYKSSCDTIEITDGRFDMKY